MKLSKADINIIKRMAKDEGDSTITRIEIAERLPHKSMSETFNLIFQLETKMGAIPELRKVRNIADKNLLALGESMVSNFEKVSEVLKF
tara:strand:- start:332 stop:598 length:267 start_codon:yes stop_codon:yes gene_type:complete